MRISILKTLCQWHKAANTHKLRMTCAVAILFCGGAAAQNLEESLTVEGKYVPEQIAAERLSIQPSVMTFSAPKAEMQSEMAGIPVNFAPDALSMPATGWRTMRNTDTSRGYLDLSLGSWLNASLSAGYAAIAEKDTRLNVWLRHRSTSLWHSMKRVENRPHTFDSDRRFRYDETIGADFTRKVADKGNFAADLQYHLGYFNYYNSRWLIREGEKGKAPTQTINDLYLRLGWEGESASPFSYALDADLRYFGFRRSYIVSTGAVHVFPMKGQRETALNVGGTLGYSFAEKSKANIGLKYSGVLNNIGNDVNRLRITPGYEYGNGSVWLRIGADLAVVGAEKTRFRIAPDVRFTAKSGNAAFSATIGGGTHLRTLAWQHRMDYYGNPGAGCHNAAYSPIDARVALQLNPGGKCTFGVEALWRTTLDETLGGIYQAYLNLEDKYLLMTLPSKLRGFSVGFNAGYEFSRFFGLKGRFNWQPQHGSRGILNGFDRPAITARVSATSNPIDALSLTLDYDLRAKRELVKGNISRLNFSALYRFTDKISVGAELLNLLNRHEMLLPELPSEAFTASASLHLLF